MAIRIQLGAMPAMLGDVVVQLLGGDAKAEIVGRATHDRTILADARSADADLLVVRAGSDGGTGPVAQVRMAAGLDILEIAGDAHSGILFHVGETPVTLDRDTLALLLLRRRRHA